MGERLRLRNDGENGSSRTPSLPKTITPLLR